MSDVKDAPKKACDFHYPPPELTRLICVYIMIATQECKDRKPEMTEGHEDMHVVVEGLEAGLSQDP
jgi:hypothetical protein